MREVTERNGSGVGGAIAVRLFAAGGRGGESFVVFDQRRNGQCHADPCCREAGDGPWRTVPGRRASCLELLHSFFHG